MSPGYLRSGERLDKIPVAVAELRSWRFEQDEAIGNAIGRPVRFEELSPGAVPAGRHLEFPAPVVEDLLKSLASYVGQTAYIAADLEKVIGRPATSYAQWAVQHADAYR